MTIRQIFLTLLILFVTTATWALPMEEIQQNRIRILTSLHRLKRSNPRLEGCRKFTVVKPIDDTKRGECKNFGAIKICKPAYKRTIKYQC